MTHRNPVGDVGPDLEAERVAVEAERLVGIVDGDEHGRDGEHASTVRAPLRRIASPILLGQPDAARSAGTVLPPRAGHEHAHARWNRLDGAVVAIAILRRGHPDQLGEARTERPERGATDRDAGVGDRVPCRSRAFARSIRRVIRYE